MAIATLTIDIVAKLASLQTGMDRAAQLAERSAKRMDAAFAAAGRAITGVLGGLSAGALVVQFRDLVGAIDDLADSAEGLGVGAVALAELRSKAQEAGVDAATLDNALGKLNNRLVDAANGNKEAAAAFAAMGIAVRDAQGNIRGTEDVLRDIADRFSTYANTAEKGALAAEVFGEKVGRKLVAYLSQGSEGLRQFTGLTEQTVAEAGKLQREIDRLTNSLERLKNVTLSGVVPALNDTQETVSRLDFGKIIAAVTRAGTPSAGLVEYFRQLNESARSTVQGREALEKYAATFDEVDRLLKRSPGAQQRAPVVPRDTAAAASAARSMQELNREITAYADQIGREKRSLAEWLGVQEIRAAEEGYKALQAEIERVNELTGRAEANKLVQDLALIDDYFFAGKISAEEYDNAVRRITGATEQMAATTEEASNFARDLGLTFTSAFEDAIVGGEGLRDVLKGLEKDLLRIGTRKLVTEPLGKWFEGLLGSGGGGIFSSLSGLFGGLFGMATGGPVNAGQPYIVGEKGPELFVPKASGNIVPNHRMGGGTVININVAGNATPATANQIGAQVGRALALAGARGFA